MVKELANFAAIFGCLIFATARSETNCNIPDSPKNGAVQVSYEPKLGTLAQYFCDVDSTLVGESISTCLPSGKWSFEAPKCLRSCYVSEIEDGQLGRFEWKNQFTRRDFISFQVGKRIRHHEKVIILCKEDYIPGNKEMGRSQEVECIDGSWTEPLYCRPRVSCEMPDAPKHGSVQLSGKLKVGTLAFFSCDEGATLVGVSTTKCLSSEKWSFDPPTCLLSCRNAPPIVETAEVVAINDKHGGKVTYNCKENFEKFKNETVVCDFGMWKGNPPLCKKMFCLNSPPSNENAHVVTVISKHEGKVTYECNEDVEKIKNETVVCDFGTWKGNPPVCKRKNCIVPNLQHGDMKERSSDYYWSWKKFLYERQPNAKISTGTVVGNGTSKVLVCHRHYSFQGTALQNRRITCSNGLWEPNPVCLPAPCNITEIQNGVIGKYERKVLHMMEFKPLSSNYKIQENETLYLRCHDKYLVFGSLESEESVSCRYGKWSRKLQCDSVSCDINPPLSENARIVAVNPRFGGKVTYECDENFEKIENETVVCFSRIWKGKVPVCKSKNCTVPSLQHGDMKEHRRSEYYWSWKSFRYEGQVYYKKIQAGTVIGNNVTVTLFCPDRYLLISKKEITCIGGLWKPDPVCVRDVR